jgi:hypothetical protein
MKLTRRQLAAVVAAPAVAAQAPPSDAAKELEAARETLRRNAEALARFKLPPETEPAFQFKP